MATFFGEVLPVVSRAVDDDEEDESEVAEICPLSIDWNSSIEGLCQTIENGPPMACSTLVIGVGPAASAFIESYLLSDDYDRVAALCSGFSSQHKKVFEKTSPTQKTCLLYRSNNKPDQFICVCNCTISPEQSFSWTQQVFEHLNASNAHVVVLMSTGVSEYRTDSLTKELKLPFLRALKTKAFTTRPACPFLEQPNIINGLPAQILSHLHIQNIPAILYTCFTDTIFLDSRTVQAFKPILSSSPFKDNFSINSSAIEVLKKIIHLQTSSNTLYL